MQKLDSKYYLLRNAEGNFKCLPGSMNSSTPQLYCRAGANRALKLLTRRGESWTKVPIAVVITSE